MDRGASDGAYGCSIIFTEIKKEQVKDSEELTTKGTLPYGKEMPMDFWNYKINPILGYRYEPQLKIRG
jgi:hypothetical protein